MIPAKKMYSSMPFAMDLPIYKMFERDGALSIADRLAILARTLSESKISNTAKDNLSHECVQALYVCGYLTIDEAQVLTHENRVKLIWIFDSIIRLKVPYIKVVDAIALPLATARIWGYVQAGYLTLEQAKMIEESQSFILNNDEIIDAINKRYLSFDDALKIKESDIKIVGFKPLIKAGYLAEDEARSLTEEQELVLKYKEIQALIQRENIKFEKFQNILSFAHYELIKIYDLSSATPGLNFEELAALSSKEIVRLLDTRSLVLAKIVDMREVLTLTDEQINSLKTLFDLIKSEKISKASALMLTLSQANIFELFEEYTYLPQHVAITELNSQIAKEEHRLEELNTITPESQSVFFSNLERRNAAKECERRIQNYRDLLAKIESSVISAP